jgi:hypothetical protein
MNKMNKKMHILSMNRLSSGASLEKNMLKGFATEKNIVNYLNAAIRIKIHSGFNKP